MSTVTELPSPLTLVPRAQAGDEQAMNHLLNHITPYVSRICRSITRDDAADATQEALLAIYRGLGTLREPVAFYGWVRAVTVREAVRTARRFGEEQTCSEVESHHQANPLDAVHITDVLDRLSRPHRQVLTLRAYGLNEGERAEVLALPVGPVRSRLFRARRRFQEAWQPSAA
ncbi:RNA polymerase sigma factor [Streptomyces galbus]|uniref:RNA polymerase sigma factor n=1 Tax=Streptomyces galbus TaxID=33898 RepID=A0ABX1ITN9_STRGB|nr:RNA polymerase sigma factor [Streptomyces galbus]NKQ27578.1 RNA polymerase sigma factor [Streptomyces galbus]